MLALSFVLEGTSLLRIRQANSEARCCTAISSNTCSTTSDPTLRAAAAALGSLVVAAAGALPLVNCPGRHPGHRGSILIGLLLTLISPSSTATASLLVGEEADPQLRVAVLRALLEMPEGVTGRGDAPAVEVVDHG